MKELTIYKFKTEIFEIYYMLCNGELLVSSDHDHFDSDMVANLTIDEAELLIKSGALKPTDDGSRDYI